AAWMGVAARPTQATAPRSGMGVLAFMIREIGCGNLVGRCASPAPERFELLGNQGKDWNVTAFFLAKRESSDFVEAALIG
ncbi:MAG: hypothetical protein ACPG4K_15050, partial [Haloferula sp.]